VTDRRVRVRAVGSAVLAAAALAAIVSPAASSDGVPQVLVVRVGTLHVGDGSVITDALLTFGEGRFARVETGAALPGTIDLASAHATPGWVDAVTQLGVRGGAVESVEVLTPGVRAADAFDPDARALAGLLEQGVTTLGLLPGPGNVACGRAGVAGLVAGGPARVLVREGPPVFAFQRPALGPQRVPATLAGARRLLEAAFAGKLWRTPAEADFPVREQALDRLAAPIDGMAFAYVDGVDAAEMASELLSPRASPVLVGLAAAGRDPAAVAALGHPCVVTGLAPSSALHRLTLPARLVEAGGRVIVSSGAPSTSPRSLRLALSLAVANGLPTGRAVEAVTGGPADALGIGDRVGRAAVGREGDLVVYDGPPWEARSRILLVVSDGTIAVDRRKGGR
jgi:imidazolonepropionase-like amidohydrolase